jgi:hypothetical protein
MAESYQTKIRTKQGAATEEVASGGELDILSGGVLDVQSGAALKLGSVTMTRTAAQLNAQGAAMAEQGKATAEKNVVLGAYKELDEVHAVALYLGAAAGTAITAAAAELNVVHLSTAGTAVASKAAVLGTNKELHQVHAAALYLGAAAGTQIVPAAALINLLATGVAGGYKVARGVAACTGTLVVNTGLTAVIAAGVTLGQTPTLTEAWVSVAVPGTTNITVKAWKPTAVDDCTPIASTSAGVLVDWIALGT